MANIVLVEANSATYADAMIAIDTARNLPGVSVVSMSFGWTEGDGTDQINHAGENSMDALFTTPAGHQGITFVAASGDKGSPGVYPALSPNVLAVGGTSLVLAADGTYSSETGWSGSGGGSSIYEPEPDYQQGVQQSGFRQGPDVAFGADPTSWRGRLQFVRVRSQ